MFERFRSGVGIKREIQKSRAPQYPEIHTLSTRPRGDGAGSNPHEVYKHILGDELPVLDPDKAVRLSDKHIIIATRIPASSHTTESVSMGTHGRGESSLLVAAGATSGETGQQPAHIINWLMGQSPDGTYFPVSYLDLATLPPAERKLVLTHFGDRLVSSHQKFAEVLAPEGKKSMIYATVGYHPQEARQKDGNSRGAQSNATVHFMDNVLPRSEKAIAATALEAKDLLKQLDPLSGKAFDATKRPITHFLNKIVKARGLGRSAKVAHFSEKDGEAFPHGWKVSFGNGRDPQSGVDMAEGLDLFMQFYGEMQTLWYTARQFRRSPHDRDLRKKVATIIGASGVDFLRKLKPIKGELSSGEFANLRKRVEERWSSVATESKDINQKLFATLMMDMVSDSPTFTIPGVPSFNIAFDVSSAGKLQSLLIIPALSEKGVIERVTGSVVRREEGGASAKPTSSTHALAA